LSFHPGEAYEAIKLAGLPHTVKIAHMLAYSRMPIVARPLRQEPCDGRPRQLRVPLWSLPAGIYDSMKTALEAIFVCKARLRNRRFLRFCCHHLVELVAYTPAAGWKPLRRRSAFGVDQCHALH